MNLRKLTVSTIATGFLICGSAAQAAAYHLINVLADYLGKLAENILNNRDIKVSVGYILIYLTALTRVLNYCFRDCLEKAYSRVKRNKDIMFDGNYVGMKDEKYAEAKSLVKNRRLNDN